MIKYFYLTIFLFLGAATFAQTTWHFENEIKAFEKADILNPPKKGQILFIGSSSFKLWTDMEKRFDDYNIIRRGFGGAELVDVNHFSGRILFPYHPAKVFLYAGANDISAGKSVDQTYEQFLVFYKEVSSKLPKAKVYFLSAKSSPGKKNQNVKFEQLNERVKAYISNYACNWTYVDVSTPLLGSDGLPQENLFQADKIHMTSAGYDIWEKIIRNYL